MSLSREMLNENKQRCPNRYGVRLKGLIQLCLL